MEKEISLQDLIKVIWKGKIIITISLFIVLIVTFIGVKIHSANTSRVSTIVALQWEGSSDGFYPDGSNFNYKHLVEPNIIADTLEKINLSVINDYDLRSAIEITPIIPNNITAAIEKAIKEGKEYEYYPTHYKLTLNHGALNLKVNKAQSLLNELVEQFREYFNKKYINKTQITNLNDVDTETLEYIDLYQMYSQKLEFITSVVSLRLEESNGFVSDNLKIGFNDIMFKCTLLKTLTLNQIISRIETYYLAKDAEYLISKYSNEIIRLEYELTKAIAIEENLQTLITNYKGNTGKIIIPGIENGQIIEFDPYYDQLIEYLLEQQNKIVEMENEIIYYNDLIARYQGESLDYTVTPEERQLQQQKLEADIIVAAATLKNIINDTNVLLRDHNQVKVSGIIKPLSTPQRQSNVNTGLYLGVASIIGISFGVAIVLFRHNWK